MARLDDIFALVDPVITGLVTTSGTLVAPYSRTVASDPDTLQEVVSGEALGTPMSVILSEVTPADITVAPGIEVMLGDWKMTGSNDFSPAIGSLIKVTGSLEGRFVGKVAKVLGSRITGAGILTTVYLRPERP